jgi:hypothetical protein
MNDSHDEIWFRSLLYKTITANFCTPKGEDTLNEEESFSDEEDEDEDSKPLKKAVTFKTGLLSERNAAEFYRGALINIDQVIFFFFCLKLKSHGRRRKKFIKKK